MSEIDIRESGIITVDPDSLRDASSRWRLVAREAASTRDALDAAVQRLGYTGAQHLVSVCAADLESAVVTAHDFADRLAHLASAYEIVEARVAADWERAGGTPESLAAAEARLARLAQRDPDAVATADDLERNWTLGRHAPMRAQLEGGLLTMGVPGGLSALVSALTVGAISALGRGRTGPVADRQTGPGDAVQLRAEEQTSRTGEVRAPTDLDEVLSRVPSGGDDRILVERYTMPDGSNQTIVYVSGTRTLSWGTDEAFDMQSNLDLYGGEAGSSSEAVFAALEDAGVTPDEPVTMVAYSQGAMTASRVAMSGEFSVVALITAGNPVQPMVGDDVLSIALRHTDDPVSALADGGNALPVGSEGSVVVRRLVDPGVGVGDLSMPAHRLDDYRETARQVDAAPDPRLATLRETIAGWGAAAAVTATRYSVARVLPGPTGPPSGEPVSRAPSSAAGATRSPKAS